MSDPFYTLFESIDRHFDEEELKDLCFRLEDKMGIDYDGLRGENKKNKARELVRFFPKTKPDQSSLGSRQEFEIKGQMAHIF